jgi:molybdopterin/thiamine biosynthesis adenylyltransferase
VIGAGGLGSPVALYLGTAGVGTITLVDHDTVDLTNLQRQIAHNLARVGQPKVGSAAQAIAAINPEVRVVGLQERADAQRLDALVAAADVVLDCSDNFSTRHAVNAACVAHRKPLVSGAAIGFDGQISVYDTRSETKPCYACIFPPEATFEEVRCATMGVFAPLVGIIGSDAGGRGAEAARRRGQFAGRTAADARCTIDGVERDPRRAGTGVPGLRRAASGHIAPGEAFSPPRSSPPRSPWTSAPPRCSDKPRRPAARARRRGSPACAHAPRYPARP